MEDLVSTDVGGSRKETRRSSVCIFLFFFFYREKGKLFAVVVAR